MEKNEPIIENEQSSQQKNQKEDSNVVKNHQDLEGNMQLQQNEMEVEKGDKADKDEKDDKDDKDEKDDKDDEDDKDNKDDKDEKGLEKNIQKVQIEEKKEIIEESKEQIEEESDETVGQKFFMKAMTSDQVLLSSILNLPLDKVISILEALVNKVELPAIQSPFLPISKSDPLDFVFQLHEEEQKYLQYMKEYKKRVYQAKIKKSEIFIEEQERQIQFEDAKCQICTDGDYTDDNLIVFCSTCNISLHQRCVGLAKVPAESWVCDVCQAFGPAGINLPCPLCNIKGGAMKRTNIHIDSNLWKQLNPDYCQYSKKCPYNKQKQQYIDPKKKVSEESLFQNNQQKQQLYYDYFNKATFTNDQPVCHYVWVHYVCSIWVPECYFEEKNGAINVKGIQNIEKKRYKHECFVCKKSKVGACVKCDDSDCKKYYHPECARKKKVYMEQLNLQKIKYLIFCEEHEPLKITRQIQYKKKKIRDQIIKFTRTIQKYIETYKIAIFPFKLMKIIPTKSFIQTFENQEKSEQSQKKIEVIEQTDQNFLKQIIIKLSKLKKISVTVVKTETGLKILNVNQPSRREMRKCLNKYDDFWHTIQNGQSAEQNCKRYDRIMKENIYLKDKMETFLNGGSLAGSSKQLKAAQKIKKGKARGRNAKHQLETQFEQVGVIFCICRKPYQNELDMFACQICEEWYHFKCIGFIGSESDARRFQFHCMMCMKNRTEEQRKLRFDKCKHMFAMNSIYLNYIPPTPKLTPEENDLSIQQEFILEEPKKIRVTIPKQSIFSEKQEKDINGKSIVHQEINAFHDLQIKKEIKNQKKNCDLKQSPENNEEPKEFLQQQTQKPTTYLLESEKKVQFKIQAANNEFSSNKIKSKETKISLASKISPLPVNKKLISSQKFAADKQ